MTPKIFNNYSLEKCKMVLIKQENYLLNDGKLPCIKDILEKRRNCINIFGIGEGKMTFATLETQTGYGNIPIGLSTEKEVVKINSMIQSNPK